MREYRDWIAFHRQSPLDPDRIDLAAATVCSAIARYCGLEAVPRAEFMPRFGPPPPPPPPQSPAEIRAALLAAGFRLAG